MAFCERCVESSETLGGYGQARCLVSGEELDYLGSANLAQPFWDRLDSFFRFPLHKNGLLVLAAFAALSWLLLGLASVSGSLGVIQLLLGGLFLLACMTRYGFMILEQSAGGRFEPPPLRDVFSGSGFNVLLQQVVVQVLFGGFTFLVALLQSEFLNILANALVMFVLPASLMILAIEGSIVAAVSPASISHMIRSIGWPYLLLYLFLYLLLGLMTALFGMFVEEVPGHLFVPLFVVLVLFFSMVAYHLMGYVVFQYQADIGFMAEDQQTRERRRRSIDPVDAKAVVLVKDGQYEAAVQVLSRHLRANPDSVRHHDQLSRLLLAMGDTEQALAHGQRYMTVLEHSGDVSRLYFLYNSLVALSPQFKPEEPSVLLALAHQLYSRGRFREVCQLLANLHQTAPHFDGLPDAYLVLARALLDGFGQKQKASQYLQFIKSKYPRFHDMTAVEQLLAQCRD